MLAQGNSFDRWKAGLAAGVVQAGLGYVLFIGLAGTIPVHPDSVIKIFDVLPPPPPPVRQVVVKKVHHVSHAGAASQPNLKAKRTEVVSPPPPPIAPPLPPPLVVAQQSDIGTAAKAGNSTHRGTGTGNGGIGNGTGSGGGGYGDGSEGTPPRQIKGRLKKTDFHREPGSALIDRNLEVKYRIGADGRVTHCTVTRPSGEPNLDMTTCRLIEARFVFKPARDNSGHPVPCTMLQSWSWHESDFDSGPDDDGIL